MGRESRANGSIGVTGVVEDDDEDILVRKVSVDRFGDMIEGTLDG
jgi:hypothetical protein